MTMKNTSSSAYFGDDVGMTIGTSEEVTPVGESKTLDKPMKTSNSI